MTGLWKPVTEADVLEGIKNGSIKETHFMELKQQARPEAIAQTIASLAIDGGLFILGVAEEKDESGIKRLVPKPLALDGISERVDQVSRNSIDPPMTVRSYAIASEFEEDRGYLVIEVEQSHEAPHMADNKYYGRGETSKHPLSDNEVLRHHALRQQQSNRGIELLDIELKRDYLTPSQSRFGHIYLIAEPLAPVSQSGLARLQESHEIKSIINSSHPDAPYISLAPSSASETKQRANGTAFVSRAAAGDGRKPNPAIDDQAARELALLDVEVTNGGGIRVYLGCGTVAKRDFQYIDDELVVAYTLGLAEWIRELSQEMSYRGPWILGLRVTKTRGKRAASQADMLPSRGGALDDDDYTRVTTATSRQIQDESAAVVKTLVGDLIRVLGSDYLPWYQKIS